MPETTPTPRLGMRYGPDVWNLRTGRLYSEHMDKVIPARVKNVGVTPAVPSLKASVEGIWKCYSTSLVMGLDPEFFLTKNGQVVPAFEHLPDKHAASDGLFWDGFQGECTVNVNTCPGPQGCLWLRQEEPPSTDLGTCRKHRITCHAILAQKLGKKVQALGLKGLGIAPQAIWRIPPTMLQWAAEAHVALGCDPSRNAYGHFGRCVVEPRGLAYRFAGGHLHFELEAAERENLDHIRYLVKTLDAIVGIPAVCLARNYDHFIRRRYYGLAGEYRLPPHGLEWRTLSNFWMVHPQAFMLVFDLARHALYLGQARLRNIFVGANRESAIQDTINYCDVRSARDFMRLNREFYSAWASMMYGSSKAFWAAIEGGVDKVIPNWGQDVVGDWQLSDSWLKVPAWRDLG